MGTESSVPEGRVKTYENTISHSTNSSLLFHPVHGENIKLERNQTVASRPEGFCKGNWSGALRIGFTMHDPASLRSKLPLYACPNLTAVEGNWVKAIAERMAKKDSILYYYVEENGDVYYGIDSLACGFFFGGVNTRTKLWAVLDIYGNTISVEFLNIDSLDPCRNQSSNNNFRKYRQLNNAASSALNLNTSSDLSEDLCWDPEIHGKNINIINNNHAFTKVYQKSQAYIFLNKSLKLGWRIALEVLLISVESSRGSLVYGVTSCDPSTIDSSTFPDDPNDLLDRPEYWIVKYDNNMYVEGDIILYSIDKSGKVSVRKNQDEFVSFHVDPTQPLWLFFNLTGRVAGLGIITAVCSDDMPDIESLHISWPSEDEGKELEPGTSNPQASSECVICYDKSVDCALYRCGHMCMCYKCAKELWQPGVKAVCPLCRKEIVDVIKVYK